MTELNRLRRENADLRHKLGVRDRQLAKLRERLEEAKAEAREAEEEASFEARVHRETHGKWLSLRAMRMEEAAGSEQ